MTNINLNDVYLRAHYYDIVFNRDVSAHIEFCQAAFQHFSGRALASMIDIACGPGYHAQTFARAGIKAYGLDLSTSMLDFGRQQCTAQGINVEFIEADMRAFQLDAPVDLALCVFDGVDLLTSLDGVVEHVRSVYNNLAPGGLYIIEQTHPRYASIYALNMLRWEGERDGTHVEFVWGVNQPQADIASGLAEIHMEMRINDHGQEQVIHSQSIERTTTIQEMKVVAEHVVGGMKVVGYYGDFDLNQPLDWSPSAESMITILQKIG